MIRSIIFARVGSTFCGYSVKNSNITVTTVMLIVYYLENLVQLVL